MVKEYVVSAIDLTALREQEDREYAEHLSRRLREIGDKMAPGDDRSLVFLCSGYIAGQRMRIEEMLGGR